LGEEALTWLDFEITLKPTAPNGLILYNGHRGDGFGDFMALYLRDGCVEFAYDLGTGAGIVTSQHRISLGEWHRVRTKNLSNHRLSKYLALVTAAASQTESTELFSC
jgi:hypothetical protein